MDNDIECQGCGEVFEIGSEHAIKEMYNKTKNRNYTYDDPTAYNEYCRKCNTKYRRSRWGLNEDDIDLQYKKSGYDDNDFVAPDDEELSVGSSNSDEESEPKKKSKKYIKLTDIDLVTPLPVSSSDIDLVMSEFLFTDEEEAKDALEKNNNNIEDAIKYIRSKYSSQKQPSFGLDNQRTDSDLVAREEYERAHEDADNFDTDHSHIEKILDKKGTKYLVKFKNDDEPIWIEKNVLSWWTPNLPLRDIVEHVGWF